jgi:hypothetical protein
MKSILVWVDDFEKFYQMPVKVFEQFASTENFDKLLSIGYSLHDEDSGMLFKDKETNQIEELIKDLNS